MTLRELARKIRSLKNDDIQLDLPLIFWDGMTNGNVAVSGWNHVHGNCIELLGEPYDIEGNTDRAEQILRSSRP